MNKTEFYRQYAAVNGVKLGEAKEACFSVLEFLARCIHKYERVHIKGLGTFKKRKIAAHRIGNINGGESILVPEKEKIVFIPYSGPVEDFNIEDYVEEQLTFDDILEMFEE